MRNQQTAHDLDIHDTRDSEPANGASRSPARADAGSAQLLQSLRAAEPRTALTDASRELVERRRDEQARRRQQVLQRLREPGAGHWKRELPVQAGVIVGVETERAESLVAHTVQDLRGLTPWLGIASCGVPAEYLTLMPQLAWAEVAVRLRCPHCDSTGRSPV